MREALILAKERDVDVFNALDVMENSQFLSELKFGPGDGQLQVKLPTNKENDTTYVLLFNIFNLDQSISQSIAFLPSLYHHTYSIMSTTGNVPR